jgi:hypothetical protein
MRGITWVKDRIPAIFMYLHPSIFAKNEERVASFLGTGRTAIYNWLNDRKFWPKSVNTVKTLTWGEVKRGLSSKFASEFDHVPITSQVDVSQYCGVTKEITKYIVPFSSPGATGATKRKANAERIDGNGVKNPISVQFLTKSLKHVSPRGRGFKFPEAFAFIKKFVTSQWYAGDPTTRSACYLELRLKFAKGTDFYNQYFDDEGPKATSRPSQLANWLTRALKEIDFCTRKVSVLYLPVLMTVCTASHHSECL